MKLFLKPMSAKIHNNNNTDLGYYRLGVQTWSGNKHITTPNGDRVVCEFMLMEKNNTNNTEGDILIWDMDRVDGAGYVRHHHKGDSVGFTRRLPATLDSIKMVLEELTGNDIELEILSREEQ